MRRTDAFKQGKRAAIPGILYILVLMVGMFALMTENFLTVSNLFNVMRQGAVLIIVSLGMTLVITSGGIDLSVSSMIGLAGAVVAGMLQKGIPLWGAILMSLALTAALGFVCGTLVSRARIFPFIVTFSMSYIVQSLALGITGGGSLHIDHEGFVAFSNNAGLPTAFLITLGMILLIAYLFRRTPFGSHCCAIGVSRDNARALGIRTNHTITMCYVISSVLACVAGITLCGRVATGNALLATGTDFKAIAAVVIGGTPISGGKGTLAGSIMGALFITILNNGLTLLGASSELTSAVLGLSVMLAVVLMQTFYNRQAKKRGAFT